MKADSRSAKLLNYSLLAAGCPAGGMCSGQIIYTDIDSDEILFQTPEIDEGLKYLDFDADGTLHACLLKRDGSMEV